jgi:hypothetical protein
VLLAVDEPPPASDELEAPAAPPPLEDVSAGSSFPQAKSAKIGTKNQIER